MKIRFNKHRLLAFMAVAVLVLCIWVLTHPMKVYGSCKQAKLDGHVNIHKGQSGYSPSLDRDGDGIACEGS